MSLIRALWNWLQPAWKQQQQKHDPHHSYKRTLCESYQKRREHVKTFWIVAGLVILVEPVLHFAILVSMFTTFLSFMYLDEAGS